MNGPFREQKGKTGHKDTEDTEVHKGKPLIHEIIPVGWLQCNCSVLGDPATREAIVVDPGDEVEKILAAVRKHNLNVRAILNTHAHIDHVGGLVKMREATGAPVLMHHEDLALYRILDQQARMIGMPVPALVEVEEFLNEGDTVRWGGYEGRVMHTPGHSKGSCCLHIPRRNEAQEEKDGKEEEKLIAGDTLFAGSIGRTDLWGGSMESILRSIHTKLLALPDDTVVYPGHGPATTIADEREMNPFLRTPN
jgi:glyoxylase-like metal-dependent hydrolase (beta-lactamase superfamily II)